MEESFLPWRRAAVASLVLILVTITSSPLRSCTALSSSSSFISTHDNGMSHQRLQSSLTGKMILAPLTKGGNLPFRRLCADFGMDVSLSEMVYARSLLKGSPVEHARVRRWEGERTFGVQLATNQIDEGLEAMRQLAAGKRPDFIDLNCGCPIYDVTRRGLGSSLLRSPKKLHKLVKGLANNGIDGAGRDAPLPVTVKIRLGCEADTINVLENVRAVREAGAAAITIHGRTAQQGYSKGANWDLIRRAVIESEEGGYGHVPIIGNGDILTYYEARRRMEESGVHAVMVGRGALTKPWIFQEFCDNATWHPTVRERVEVYHTLAMYMKEHFGNDAMGRKKSWVFLPWHFEFLSRYRPYPVEQHGAQSAIKPLMQHRVESDAALQDPLEVLLANRNSDAHDGIASILWESRSPESAFRKLAEFSESQAFRDIVATGALASAREDEVLANRPPAAGKPGRWIRRRGRKPGPKRTEEEIAEIRAERAEKKERILASGGEWPPN